MAEEFKCETYTFDVNGRSKQGDDINGKYLTYNGQQLTDANGNPYKVPADFNLDDFTKKYQEIGNKFKNGELSATDVATVLYDNFRAGHSDDLQRTSGRFCDDFRPAASVVFGVACDIVGVSQEECLRAGGAVNIIQHSSYRRGSKQNRCIC